MATFNNIYLLIPGLFPSVEFLSVFEGSHIIVPSCKTFVIKLFPHIQPSDSEQPVQLKWHGLHSLNKNLFIDLI